MIKQLIKKLCNFVPIKGEKIDYKKGLRISHSIVPNDFIQSNPSWDKHLFKNIQIIK